MIKATRREKWLKFLTRIYLKTADQRKLIGFLEFPGEWKWKRPSRAL